MIKELKGAAEDAGINAVITNSTEKVETQLNRITREEYLPIMLVSWDYVVNMEFNANGFLNNPTIAITLLLMTKADDLSKEEMEKSSELMGGLFQIFLQNLHNRLIAVQTDNSTPPITGASYTNVPSHGLGKHSGVLASFTMKSEVINCISLDVFEEPIGIGVDVIGLTTIK